MNQTGHTSKKLHENVLWSHFIVHGLENNISKVG